MASAEAKDSQAGAGGEPSDGETAASGPRGSGKTIELAPQPRSLLVRAGRRARGHAQVGCVRLNPPRAPPPFTSRLR